MSNATGKSFLLSIFLGGIAWGSTRIYANYCVPEGFTGFLQSLVTMDSSPCQAVFALISHSNTLYASMIAAMLFSIFSGFHDIIVYVSDPRGQMPRQIIPPLCECPLPAAQAANPTPSTQATGVRATRI